MKYRKKPVVIEAVQFTGGIENLEEIRISTGHACDPTYEQCCSKCNEWFRGDK